VLDIVEVLSFKVAKPFGCWLLVAKLGSQMFDMFGLKWQRQYE
jgi:hypothetical protein